MIFFLVVLFTLAASPAFACAGRGAFVEGLGIYLLFFPPVWLLALWLKSVLYSWKLKKATFKNLLWTSPAAIACGVVAGAAFFRLNDEQTIRDMGTLWMTPNMLSLALLALVFLSLFTVSYVSEKRLFARMAEHFSAWPANKFIIPANIIVAAFLTFWIAAAFSSVQCSGGLGKVDVKTLQIDNVSTFQ